MIITWILDESTDGLIYVTTASKVRNELHERFSSVNGHRIFQILRAHSPEQENKLQEVLYSQTEEVMG